MSNIILFESLKKSKRCKDNPVIKNTFAEEYKDYELQIDGIKNFIIKQYEVSAEILDMLIENVQEKTAMEYENQDILYSVSERRPK